MLVGIAGKEERWEVLCNFHHRVSHRKLFVMAVIMDQPVVSRRRAGIRRIQKKSPGTDLTPMVDLGFLLITFFVITTEFSKPMVTKLNMPADGPPIKLGESSALTVLLGSDNTVYYYEGGWEKACRQTRFSPRALTPTPVCAS